MLVQIHKPTPTLKRQRINSNRIDSSQMHEKAYLFAEKFLGTFEDMIAGGILTREQAEKRLKSRKNFIYDFMSSATSFDRFLDYMNSEITFLHTIKQRTNIICTYLFLDASLAKGQILFILRLFESASRKYFDLPQYWEFYINFLKENGSAKQVSRFYTRLVCLIIPTVYRAISKHPTNIQLWLGYIDWERSTRRSTTACRCILYFYFSSPTTTSRTFERALQIVMEKVFGIRNRVCRILATQEKHVGDYERG